MDSTCAPFQIKKKKDLSGWNITQWNVHFTVTFNCGQWIVLIMLSLTSSSVPFSDEYIRRNVSLFWENLNTNWRKVSLWKMFDISRPTDIFESFGEQEPTNNRPTEQKKSIPGFWQVVGSYFEEIHPFLQRYFHSCSIIRVLVLMEAIYQDQLAVKWTRKIATFFQEWHVAA